MFSISAILGFTFPGIILEPGSTAGSLISLKPVFGPELNNLRSFAILFKSTAKDFIVSENCKKSVMFCVVYIGSFDSFQGILFNFIKCLIINLENFGFVLIPVPIAFFTIFNSSKYFILLLILIIFFSIV